MGRPDLARKLKVRAGELRMDTNDRAAISALFERLARVEAEGPARDPEAQAMIDEGIARHPGAAYFLAQTVLVQEQALKAAQARITALEAKADSGFFSGWFPDAPAPQRPQRAQSGFLAGAAQTALGVAGGVFLANALSEMMGQSPNSDEGESASDDWW